MKSLQRLFILLLFTVTVTAVGAQSHEEQVRTAMRAASDAFNDGKYREAISLVQRLERLIESTTEDYPSYIKIISYYRLGEYQNCTDAAKAYLSTSPKNSREVEEIRTADADSRKKLAAKKAEADRIAENAQKKAAREKAATEDWIRVKDGENVQAMEAWLNRYGDTPLAQTARNRITEVKNLQAARSKNAFEKEAADEWERIRTTENVQTVQQFLNRYSKSAMAQTARNRITALNEMHNSRTKYAALQKTLKQQKKERNKGYLAGAALTVVGAGVAYGGYYLVNKEVEEGKDDYKTPGYICMGLGGLLSVGGIVGISIMPKTWGRKINQTKSEMNSLRPSLKLSLQPEIMPLNPSQNIFDHKNLAYGFRTTVTF